MRCNCKTLYQSSTCSLMSWLLTHRSPFVQNYRKRRDNSSWNICKSPHRDAFGYVHHPAWSPGRIRHCPFSSWRLPRNDSCPPTLACESEWCLKGFRVAFSNSFIHQTNTVTTSRKGLCVKLTWREWTVGFLFRKAVCLDRPRSTWVSANHCWDWRNHRRPDEKRWEWTLDPFSLSNPEEEISHDVCHLFQLVLDHSQALKHICSIPSKSFGPTISHPWRTTSEGRHWILWQM